ncbi:MAG: uroporphyrinogen-III synthase [Candidatus Krumholzibacteriia bacterium]
MSTTRDERAVRVLVTREDPRPVEDAVVLAGGKPVGLSLLVTRWLPFEIPGGRRLADYDWVAFTSVRALQGLVAEAERLGWDWPPEVPSAAVGDRTAHELQARGWMPECVSDDRSARGLVECLSARDVVGARILFPCSAIAEPTFPEGMRQSGAQVDVVSVYTTESTWARDPQKKAELESRLVEALEDDAVATCASPSAARALAELAEAAGVIERLRATPIVVIGPTTAKAVHGLGLQAVEAGGRSLACMARKAVEVGRKTQA